MTQGSLNQPLLTQKKVEEPPLRQIGFFEMFKFADSKDRALMWIGSLAALASGAVMPFFSFLFGDVTMIYVKPNPIEESLKIAIKFWILGGAAWLLNFISIYCWSVAGERQSLRYRKIYYRLLLKQEVFWYDTNNPNQLATKVSTEVTAIQGAIGEKIAQLLTVSVMSTLGFFLAYFKNWRLSLVLSATLPLLMMAGFAVMKAMQKVGQKNNKTYSEAGATAEQAIASIRTVKALTGESFELEKYTKKLMRTLSDSKKYTVYTGMSLGFMICVFLGCYGLGFWYGKVLIITQGIDVANVLSTFFCIIIGGSSIGQMAPSMKNIALGKAAIAKLFQLMERQPTLKEPTNGVQAGRIDSIELKDLQFSYPKDPDVKVLKGISLSLPQNKTTAIVGESGSGKSTIVQLIDRFYDPTSGGILINGTDLKELNLEAYRRQIGYVGQEPVMFSMTIRENMLFSKEEATEDEIVQALKSANAWEFVVKMENGLDTFIGSGGAQISGGQKQRLAIARAILKNPSMFIFDEATSALDRKNQIKIQETLHKLTQGKTTLVIAHRLSTIQKADNIVVLSQGRLVQQGTHNDLIQKKSYYYDLVKNQLNHQEDDQQTQVMEEENKESIRKQSENPEAVVEQVSEEKVIKEKAVFGKLAKECGDQKLKLLLGCLCAMINGVVFPAFSFILSNLLGIMSKLNNPFYPDQQDKIKKEVDMYCIGFGLVAMAGGLTTFIYHSFFGVIGDDLVFKLRLKAFNKLLRLKVEYFDKEENNPGAVSTKLAQDAYLIHNMVTGVIGVAILNTATLGTGLTLALYYNWRLTLIVLGLGPLLVVAGSLNMKRLKAYSSQADEAYKLAGTQISDTVCNIRTVKSFGNTPNLLKVFNKKLESPYAIAKKKAFSSGFFQGLSQAITLFVYGLVFFLAAVLQEKVHKSEPEDVFTAIFCIVFAAVGMGQNSSLMPDMAKAKVAGTNIYDIIEAEDEYQAAVSQGGTSRDAIRGKIEFQNVCFKYPSREKMVFENLSFFINAGSKVGLVGSSGCGKSTVVQLLLRFYEIRSGNILIDGRNIKEFDLYHLRENFGVVTQEPVLFNGTIKENIRYKNKNALKDEVEKAASIASATKFIEESEQGYDRQVGTKGVQISGGQKQRLAIARCALSNPNIYLFDEATSALDVETEKIVFDSLNGISKGKTCLSIAHRLATIIDSEKILVFHQGKIVEQGNYEELCAQKGYFYRLERGRN